MARAESAGVSAHALLPISRSGTSAGFTLGIRTSSWSNSTTLAGMHRLEYQRGLHPDLNDYLHFRYHSTNRGIPSAIFVCGS